MFEVLWEQIKTNTNIDIYTLKYASCIEFFSAAESVWLKHPYHKSQISFCNNFTNLEKKFFSVGYIVKNVPW